MRSSISSRVDQASGRRPSSMSWISATRRRGPASRCPPRGRARRRCRSARRPRCGACARRGRARCRNGFSRECAVERRPSHRPSAASGALVRTGREGGRIEAVEAARRDAARRGHRHHLARRAGARRRECRGEARASAIEVVGERRAEQHRAVAELAPQVGPDVRRSARRRARRSAAARACRACARRSLPSSSPTTTAAAVAAAGCGRAPSQSAPKLTKQPIVRASPTTRGDDELVEPVLRGEHEAVLGEVRRELPRRRLRMVRLHREHDAVERRPRRSPASPPARAAGTPRPDLRSQSPSRFMASTWSAIGVDEQDVLAGARADAAPRVPPMAPAPQIRIGSRHPRPSSSARVSVDARRATDRASPRRAAGRRRRNCRRREARARPPAARRACASRSTCGFSLVGGVTPASRVHGKFSIQFACEPRRIDGLNLRERVGRVPPVVELHAQLRMLHHQLAGERRDRRVAAMPVDDEDAAEARAA